MEGSMQQRNMGELLDDDIDGIDDHADMSSWTMVPSDPKFWTTVSPPGAQPLPPPLMPPTSWNVRVRTNHYHDDVSPLELEDIPLEQQQQQQERHPRGMVVGIAAAGVVGLVLGASPLVACVAGLSAVYAARNPQASGTLASKAAKAMARAMQQNNKPQEPQQIAMSPPSSQNPTNPSIIHVHPHDVLNNAYDSWNQMQNSETFQQAKVILLYPIKKLSEANRKHRLLDRATVQMGTLWSYSATGFSAAVQHISKVTRGEDRMSSRRHLLPSIPPLDQLPMPIPEPSPALVPPHQQASPKPTFEAFTF